MTKSTCKYLLLGYTNHVPSKRVVDKSKPGIYLQEGRPAKVFRTGGSAAVRIPKDFNLEDDDLMITKVNDGMLITKAPKVVSVATWWASWGADPTFMADGRKQPAMQVRDF